MRKQLQQIRITNVLDIKSVFDTENLHKNTHTHHTCVRCMYIHREHYLNQITASTFTALS